MDILEQGNKQIDISITIFNTIREFSLCFSADKPDLLILLGDRTELIGVAIATMNARIPIAHIAGGEVSDQTYN